MKEFLEKLAPYHFFNYLLPGALFVILVDKIVGYNFYQTDIILGLLLYYFIGLSISRIGSLIIEPLLRKTRFVVFADYKDFLSASKDDTKIEVLSEVNNMYRTLCALFTLLLLLKIYKAIVSTYTVLATWNEYILIGLLLVMFLYSYKKQSGYITNRVNAVSENKTEDKKSVSKRVTK